MSKRIWISNLKQTNLLTNQTHNVYRNAIVLKQYFYPKHMHMNLKKLPPFQEFIQLI